MPLKHSSEERAGKKKKRGKKEKEYGRSGLKVKKKIRNKIKIKSAKVCDNYKSKTNSRACNPTKETTNAQIKKKIFFVFKKTRTKNR